MHRLAFPKPLAGVVVALALTMACGGDGGPEGTAAGSASCGADEAERIDPGSANHVFAGGEEPEYLSEPPTSGPHEPGPARSGVLDAPLSRPQQVGQLESGAVLFQHRDDLPAEQVAALEALAGNRVAVVPSPELPAPIVATAWTRKMVCRTVDAEALSAFAEAHVGGGPGTDG